MTTLKHFSAAFKTSSKAPANNRDRDSYTDRDYEKNREKYSQQANSQHSREMHNIMKGKR